MEQTVLSSRHADLAEGRSDTAAAARLASARAKLGLAASVQRPDSLDAGQVGIPLVRGMGSGLSLCRLRADRPGLRQGAARADDARVVHAPERSVAGL